MDKLWLLIILLGLAENSRKSTARMLRIVREFCFFSLQRTQWKSDKFSDAYDHFHNL